MLTVLSVAYPFAPVSEDAVGGAEQVAWALDDALVRAGHRSLLVAQEGSRIAGELIPVPAVAGEIADDERARIHQATRDAIARTLDRERIDLVHLHGIDFHAYLPPAGVPALATLHLPPGWYPADVFRPSRPDTWLNPVSAAQHAACPPSPALLDAIPNGVAIDRLRTRVRPRAWAMAMGRICPEKGFHHALDAAHRADVPLLLAGHVYPYPDHQRYYAEQILPRLDARRRFVGPVGMARKRRLLSAARCLLVPSLAPETSSLVAMESIACGTPVVAFRIGALPEVIEAGRTGFIVDDVKGMADAIRAVDTIDRDECRAAARERFSVRTMADRYVDLYSRLATGRMEAEA